MRRFGRSAPLLGLVGVGLVAFACVAVYQDKPRAPSSEKASSPIPSAKPASESASSDPARPFDLTAFRPLLSEPKYQGVRAFLEADEVLRAGDLAEKLAVEAKGKPEYAAQAFLAGRLLEQGGARDASLRAFLEVRGKGSPLEGDASLRLAEAAFQSGDGLAAEKYLSEAPRLLGEPRALTLRARIASKKSVQSAGDLDALAAAVDQALEAGAGSDFLKEMTFALEPKLAVESGDVKNAVAHLAEVWLRRLFLGRPTDHPYARELAHFRRTLNQSSGKKDVVWTADEQVAHLRGLVESGANEEALEFAKGLGNVARFSANDCEAALLRGRAEAALRNWGRAFEAVEIEAARCTGEPSLHVKLLFNAGKYAGADGREAKAARFFEQLETLYPKDSLADDARIRRAQSYLDAGSPARFTELLLAAPDDYPDGDMTMEGVLLLALYRMQRGDWGGALLVLERGAKAVRSRDAARGHEFSGCERYFLARAQGELGNKELELREYESIVKELPLSYYMLHAYSRLRAEAPARAEVALGEGLKTAKEAPFSFPNNELFSSPDFRRGLELLRVGEVVEGERVVSRLLKDSGGQDSLLWAMALLYGEAGDAKGSHELARRRLTDWLSHYPTGDWERPWQLGFPRPHLEIAEREAAASGVPEWFIYGIMREESLFDARAESPAEAFGLMQLILPTARNLAKKEGIAVSRESLFRPRVNILLGSRALAGLTKQFVKNPWLAIPAYNAGPGRPVRWLKERPNIDFDVWVETIPFRETRRYTKRVLASRAAYAFLYHPEDRDAALLLPRRLSLP